MQGPYRCPAGAFLATAAAQTLLCISAIQSIRRTVEKQPLTCMADFPVRIPQQLPPLLQGFRKTAGLTQANVAARMGITQQTLSAMERNASQVSVSRLLKLLGVLGVELVLRSQPAAHPEDPDMPVGPAKPGKAAW